MRLKTTNLKFVKKKIKNEKDYDIYVKDCFNQEHIVFPGQQIEIVVLVGRRRDDTIGISR